MDDTQIAAGMQEPIICLQSCEGDLFEIDNEIVNLCNTVKNLLNGQGKRTFRNVLGGCFSIEDGNAILKKEGRILATVVKNTLEEVIIAFHEVKTSIMALVLEFCRFHSPVNVPLKVVTKRLNLT
eukprot:TRINITY_DN22543_c0_g1_i1.p1 TRINITY_DN22543_c0_g1~~TRINITY_DN22543_c0_g1_i1.p1  ORF type:complete len:144 (-),score=31.79 TRINITY_DN22543_c0_g1_i1:364-738(-)